MKKKLFVLSMDAMVREDIAYLSALPNFQKALGKRAEVDQVLTVYPACTYPAHTALMTGCYPDKQVYLQRENIETLVPKISEISKLYGDDGEIDFDKWFNSPYYPTPTIIAAAVEAYSSHHLSEIAQSEAGQDNINACEEKLNEVIAYAEQNKKKCVCFVT